MSRLGVQYGISGIGLAKICARLNVPYPPRGYWARKAAGQKVVQLRLPDPDDEPGEVTITPTPPPPFQLPSEVADHLTVAREKIKEVRSSYGAPLLSQPATQAAVIAYNDRSRFIQRRTKRFLSEIFSIGTNNLMLPSCILRDFQLPVALLSCIMVTSSSPLLSQSVWGGLK